MTEKKKPVKKTVKTGINPVKKQLIPKQDRVGRPTKFTPKTKGKILNAVRLGLSIAKSCNIAGIDYNTYRNWETRALEYKEPEFIKFFQECERAKDEREAFHLKQIVDASRDGTWQASAWFLERSLPNQYSLKRTMEITGKDGGPVQQEIKVISTSDILKALEIITVIPNEQQMAAIGHGDSNEGDSEDSTSYNS